MSAVLFDTSAFIRASDDRLSAAARLAHESSAEAFLSIASVWEASIKVKLGKLKFPIDDIGREIAAQGLTLLPISFAHAFRAGALPLHHKDPFDRMLAAQAAAENLAIVSPDPIFAHYGVTTIW